MSGRIRPEHLGNATEFSLYKSKVRSKWALNNLNSVTQECLSEFELINEQFESEKKRVESQYQLSLEKTEGLDHSLDGISLNKPIPLSVLDGNSIEFEEGYLSSAIVKGLDNASWRNLDNRTTKVWLSNVEGGQPIVREVVITKDGFMNRAGCDHDVKNFLRKLNDKGYFPDDSYNYRGRSFPGTIVYVTRDISFLARCSNHRAEIKATYISNYIPDFEELALKNLE